MKMDKCEQWKRNPLVNPETGRTIKRGGPTFLRLEKECSEKPSPMKKSPSKAKRKSPNRKQRDVTKSFEKDELIVTCVIPKKESSTTRKVDFPQNFAPKSHFKRKAMAIPDRWLDYTGVGQVIEGTRFIAFKVPLNEFINDSLDETKRFGMPDLFSLVDEKKLGCVIDLTNTDRYYNPSDVRKRGICYNKIFTQGHKVPNSKVCDKFFTNVNQFLERNPGNVLIGVHCTHGVNRTGYLICRYMIDVLGIDPQTAISAFKDARGHGIERQNYLDSLLARGK